ncbi:MAG: hypothetical protein K2O14_13840 [Oscillospiraceae bacterium]|nr:hypothetical protein [Oscillospiraceae bacterium]
MSRFNKESEPEKRAETAVIPPKNTGGRRAAKNPDAVTDKPAAKRKKTAERSYEAKAEAQDNPPKKAKKTAGAKSKKVSEPEKGGSKTPQVMKLVETQSDVNPVIIAGKSRIPQQLRGRAPLSKIMRREAAEIFGEYYADPNELLTVNLTELVIRENAGELLRRFNACCCDKCIDELSRRALEKIPSRFARISRAVLEKGSPELDEQKEPLKKSALSAMIRELIGNKRRHFHNG